MQKDHERCLLRDDRGKTVGFTLRAFEKPEPLEVYFSAFPRLVRGNLSQVLGQKFVEVCGGDGNAVLQGKQCVGHTGPHDRLMSQVGPSQQVVHDGFVTVCAPYLRQKAVDALREEPSRD